jgi:hypothetical protein
MSLKAGISELNIGLSTVIGIVVLNALMGDDLGLIRAEVAPIRSFLEGRDSYLGASNLESRK